LLVAGERVPIGGLVAEPRASMLLAEFSRIIVGRRRRLYQLRKSNADPNHKTNKILNKKSLIQSLREQQKEFALEPNESRCKDKIRTDSDV
jgi:hypothetical protein